MAYASTAELWGKPHTDSTFLSAEDSRYVLGLMTNTVFNVENLAQLPPDVVIAQKFGMTYTNETKNLHDCGII